MSQVQHVKPKSIEYQNFEIQTIRNSPTKCDALLRGASNISLVLDSNHCAYTLVTAIFAEI